MLTIGSQPRAADLDLVYGGLVESYVDDPRFVERRWLADRVDAALADPACRFVLLTAEPGFGKTAFLAWLAREHPDWARYFVRRNQRSPLDDPGARSFLLRTGFQLAASYPELFAADQMKIGVEQRIGTVGAGGQLVGVEVDRLLASPFYRTVVEIRQRVERSEGDTVGMRIGDWVADPRLLPLNDLQFMALIAPAQALQRSRPAEQIVLLVDALDELRYRQTTEGTLLDWLAECPELPTNVRLVLTSRPDDALLQLFRDSKREWLRELRLADDDPAVGADLRAYARALTREPAVAQVLHDEGAAGADAFVAQAVDKAHGNIGYLDAVGRAVDQGLRQGDRQLLAQALDLSALPESLEGLFAFFLLQIKDRADRTLVEVDEPGTGDASYLPAWPSVYRRILGVLAAAQESMEADQIRALGGIGVRPEYVAGALEFLRQLLDREANRYRLYHTSLAEFLVAPGTRSAHPECYLDAVEWHGRIATYYLEEWGGLDRGLPELRKPAQRALHGGYPFRHLTAHLRGAAKLDILFKLADAEWWYEVQSEVDGTGTNFSNDLLLASTVARDTNTVAIESGQPAPMLGLEARYALFMCSLGGRARSLPPALLAALVENGHWNANASLAVARQSLDRGALCDALAALLPHLDPPMKAEVLRETLAAARDLVNAEQRVRVMASVMPHLAEPQKTGVLWEALADTRTIARWGHRAAAQARLVPFLDEPKRSEVVRDTLAAVVPAAGSPMGSLAQLEAVLLLEPHLSAAQVDVAVRDALAAFPTSSVVLTFADCGTPCLRYMTSTLLREALNSASYFATASDRLTAVVAVLASYLAEAGYRDEALSIVRAGPIGERVDGLVNLLPYFDRESRKRLLDEAVEDARAIGDGAAQARTLQALALPLGGMGYRREAIGAYLFVLKAELWDDVARQRMIKDIRPKLLRSLAKQVGRKRHIPGSTNAFARSYLRLRTTSTIGSLARRLDLLLPRIVPTYYLGVAAMALGVFLFMWFVSVSWNDDHRGIVNEGRSEYLQCEASERTEFSNLCRFLEANCQQPIPSNDYLCKEVVPETSGRSSWRELLILNVGSCVAFVFSVNLGVGLCWLVRTPQRRRAHQAATRELRCSLYASWTELVHRERAPPRGELLSEIGSHWDMLVRVGGAEALAESSRAIREAGRRWP